MNRWRLEKKDPAAALSEPKQPIVFWLDRNVPVEYRETVTAGVLEWNKAFERIGFKDAIRVELQPQDADFDTADLRHASIRCTWTQPRALAIVPRRWILAPARYSTPNRRVAGRTRLPALRESIPQAHAAAPLTTTRDAGSSATGVQLGGFAAGLRTRGDLDPPGPEPQTQGHLNDVITHDAAIRWAWPQLPRLDDYY